MVRKNIRQLTTAMRARNFANRGLEPRLFGAAAGFHHLVKDLDFPAQGVPFKFLDGGGDIVDRQIGHQLPVDRRTVRRRIDLKSMDVGEKLGCVALPLAFGR
ncbi:hypothetical protein [Rhizobium mesoamericanum]|uniref:hypothetical protein n=1 Tax=Rhizobium mesoamericanum TaxID=1079800 RepID=UPI0027D8D0A4|nr:hypothetical protein [Rhizobium mesoamericanum]